MDSGAESIEQLIVWAGDKWLDGKKSRMPECKQVESSKSDS
jgi:hypothetical protein